MVITTNYGGRLASLVSLVLPLLQSSSAFQGHPVSIQRSQQRSSSSSLKVLNLRDADFMENMVGGERYEMVPLPDSMVDTTIFVGNLNEFVHDDDLSHFFCAVSRLQSLPACVVRKANMMSLEYGFVSFPSVEEKEAAILRFHGTTFMGRRNLKVEPIRDDPKKGRVRVPERMVSFVVGAAKKTSDGRVNSIRRVASMEVETKKSKAKNKLRKKKQHQKQQQQQQKSNSIVSYKLSESEQEEWSRSIRKGFVTLEGTGYRQGRRASPLACEHRQWCDSLETPQIVLCKASGGRPLDCVIVDLSPLRLSATLCDTFLVTLKTQILTAAANADMELRRDYREDNCISLLTLLEDDDDDVDCDFLSEQESVEHLIELTDEDSWATDPISKLPVLSMGVFEGERTKAKAMARELALLWEIPSDVVMAFPTITETTAIANSNKEHSVADVSTNNTNGRKQKRYNNKKDENRRRRRNSISSDEMEFFL